MDYASAPANDVAQLLPASSSSLSVPTLAASTAEAVDLSAGAAILGLLLLLCCCCLDACRLRPRKKNERRDYMHQVFISSYLPIVFLLLPFRFLVICRRYFVCTYSYMGRDSAYEVFLLFYSILHMNVWPLLCFVKLDGWEHEYNYTTASHDPGFA